MSQTYPTIDNAISAGWLESLNIRTLHGDCKVRIT